MHVRRSDDDYVTKVVFRGHKTGRIITRYCAMEDRADATVEKCQHVALSNYFLWNQPERLVSIETKRRKDWLVLGVADVKQSGTIKII